MNAPQPDSSPIVLPVLLRNITEAICDRPAESAAQRASRRREIVDMVNGLQPDDAVEMMLVSMVIAHAHLLEDATCDVFRGRDERVKAQTKSQVVALGRGVLGFLKELRTLQDRRRKAEASKAAGADGTPESGTAAVVPPEKTSVALTQPVTREATATTTTPVLAQPEPVLPPIRRADTSVPAMMATLSPAKAPVVTSADLGRREYPLTPDPGARLTSKVTAASTEARAA